MGFIESYKQLEKLCGDLLDDDRRLSAYIDEMIKTPSGAFYVNGWNDDLKKLKHYRWVRNRIVHEPNCTEQNMCDIGDTMWLDNFYSRILNQTDPLALYYKATKPRTAPKSTKTHKGETPTYTYPQRTSDNKDLLNKVLVCIVLLVAFVLVVTAMILIYNNA